MDYILQYKCYDASVHFTGDDEVCYGKISGIDDLVSYKGLSIKELKSVFMGAVEDYIELYTELKSNE